MKHHTPDSMKFKRLQRRLGLPRYAVIGLLESLWIATQKNAPQGDIGKFDDEAIAIECDWDGDPAELVLAFVETGWLDPCSENRLVVHDWKDHAPGWVSRQLKRHNSSFVTPSKSKSVTRDVLEATKPPPDVIGDGLDATPNLTLPNLTLPNQFLSSSDDEPDGSACEVNELFEAWNSTEGLPKIRKLTGERRQKALARLRNRDWPWRRALSRLPLPTRSEGDWQPDFDWFIKNDTNAEKIIDGKYDWRKPEAPRSVAGGTGQRFTGESLGEF